MKLLAIEASTLVASVALATQDSIVAEFTVNNKKTHSQTLLPMIDVIVKNVGWDLKDLDYIAVTNGPGSFTGLRIGAATAKGLAQALNKKIVPVSSLEALAMNGINFSGLVVPIMDARRDNVFTGVYEFDNDKLKIVCEQKAESIYELVNELNELNKEVLFVGDGIKAYVDIISREIKVKCHFAKPFTREQRASALVTRAYDYIEKEQFVSSEQLEVNYLRKSQAERELEEKQNKVTN